MSVPQSLFIILIGIYIVVRTVIVATRTIKAKGNTPILGSIEAKDLKETSMIVPVLFEETEILERALQSWLRNNPGEIIVVVDQRDLRSAALIKTFQLKCQNIHLIIESKNGKRPALLSGFRQSKGRYVILVDSDVFWKEDTLKNLILPLKDPTRHIGGVTGIQEAQTNTLASLLFSYQQCVRLQIQMCQYASAGKRRIPNLLGRTAAYRREALEKAMPALVEATCFGKPNAGGDDVFLANFIQSAGWEAYNQPTANYATAPAKNMGDFLRQTIRWGRGAMREASSMRLKPEIGLYATLRTYVLGIIDVVNIIILPSVLVLAIMQLFRLALIILGMSLMGTLIPLLLLPNKVFARHFIPIYLYEHLVGSLRIFAILTAMRQTWLTRHC